MNRPESGTDEVGPKADEDRNAEKRYAPPHLVIPALRPKLLRLKNRQSYKCVPGEVT